MKETSVDPQLSAPSALQPSAANPANQPVASQAPTVDSLPVPRVFGRLLLLKLLARGGMGDVYLAATTGIEGAERPCVVKTVRRDHIHDGSFLARFLDEARVQSQLNHPGVAQVLEASTDENGEPYTVVEYIEGRSLSEVRAKAGQTNIKLGWPEAVAIAIEIAQALGHIHERTGSDGQPLGIVHRDLSPQNVMVGYSGEVKLIDFGTARGLNRKCHTVAGVVFAKPGYVAPEVARQEVGDGRIDIYALGIMLWELCAGRRFLTGDAQKHLEDSAQNRVHIPEVARSLGAPALLDQVIARMTANDPEMRIRNASLLAHDLGRVLQEAPPVRPGERGVRMRTAHLMRRLWTGEPARSRSEFAKLLHQARALIPEPSTPNTASASGAFAKATGDEMALLGTPYRLIRKIGEGSSGEVYEAEHVELGRKVALKILSTDSSQEAHSLERFKREARAIASLQHPNLCLLYDFGRSVDNRVFLAMELLSGETLDKFIKRTGGMDWREACEFVIDVTRVLEVAHSSGLVHRDLKPANLFMTKQGGVKLLDFGIATAMSEPGAPEQKAFSVFGTPEYMPPEQVSGEVVDGRADIYALGVVLYELLTGRVPFEGKSPVEIMGKHLREMPEAPSVYAKDKLIPAALDSIVLTALAKLPENRFETVEAFRVQMEALFIVKRKARPYVARTAASLVVLTALAFGGHTLHKYSSSPLASSYVNTVRGIFKPEAAKTIAKDPYAHVNAFESEVGQASLTSAEVAPAEVKTSVASPESNAFTEKPEARVQAVIPEAIHAAKAEGARGGDKASEPGRKVSNAAKVTEPAVVNKKGAETLAVHPTEKSAEVPAPGTTEAAETRADEAGEKPAIETDPKGESKSAPKSDVEKIETDKVESTSPLADARKKSAAKPSNIEALRSWAEEAMKAGELKEARRAASAWMLHDRTAAPKVFLAEILSKLGRTSDARALLDEVMQSYPDSDSARSLYQKLGVTVPKQESVRKPKVAKK
ncbi:MAG: protein kinase [Polyangiaceae bacterium]|nr:protein kinase [Polyangiaceae bacterium]